MRLPAWEDKLTRVKSKRTWSRVCDVFARCVRESMGHAIITQKIKNEQFRASSQLQMSSYEAIQSKCGFGDSVITCLSCKVYQW